MESKRLNYLFRYVGNEMGMKGAVSNTAAKKLEELILEFVENEDQKIFLNVSEERDIEAWNYSLDVFEKIGRIVNNLEDYFPGCYERIEKLFSLKDMKIMLLGTLLRGSKTLRENESAKIKKEKLLDFDNQISDEEIEELHAFIRKPIPFTRDVQDKRGFGIDLPSDNKQKDNFYKQGDLAFWYLIYYMALVQREKALGVKGEKREEVLALEGKIRDMMIEKTREISIERDR